MSNLIVEVVQINETKNWQIHHNTFESAYNTPGELFRDCLKEYGKCTSKVFIDKVNVDKPVHVGWCFERLEKYSDCNEKFKCATWVTVLESMPIPQPPIVKYKEL